MSTGSEQTKRTKLGRLSDRDEVSTPCTLVVTSQRGVLRRNRTETIDGIIVNLSITGAGMVVHASSEAQTTQQLTAGLPVELAVEGQVGRVSIRYANHDDAGSQIGLTFVEIPPDLQEILDHCGATSRGVSGDLEARWNRSL